MNKIYKLIWNKVRNCYVAVSEFAKGHGKGSGVVGGAVVGTAGVNGGAKAKGRCAALTLALAVTLWIAGGVLLVPGLASAANSGGIKVDDTYRGNNGTLKNNVVVYDTTDNNIHHVEGAYGGDGNQTATNNMVTIDGKADLGSGHVAGAYLGGDANCANGNTVIINSGTINYVYGGYAVGGNSSSTASGNTVIINGGTINQSVSGGCFRSGGTAVGNTVTLNGTTIGNSVYGGHNEWEGTLTCSGNILNLSGTNTVKNDVSNFEIIQFDSERLTWSGGSTVLTAKNFENVDKLNVSAVMGKAATSGTMTLLKSETENSFASLRLVYDEATQAEPVALTTEGVVVKKDTSTKTEKGVTVAYDSVRHTVTLAENATKVNYMLSLVIHTSATLGVMSWETGGYAFTNTDVIDAAGLMVAFGDDFKVTGAENHGNGQSLNLLTISSESSGTIAGSPGTSVTVSKANQAVTTDNNLKFSWTRTDTVAKSEDSKKLVYTTGATSNVTEETFDGAIAWNTESPYYNAAGGVYKFDGNTIIDTTDLTFTGTIHENPLNQSMTLLAGATGITGDHITQAGEGKGEIAVAYTDAKGIALNARAKGEVSVASGAVKYTINSVALDKATLGSLAWGDTDSLPESWQASGTTQIDDTNFAYTGTASTALKAGNTATILTAPGLLATSPVTVGTVEGKTVDIKYTDDAGVTYTATASGHVAAAKDAVNYVVDSVAATGVNLQSWNGKDASTDIMANGWTLAAGATIETDGMTVPTVEAGKHIDILQSDTDDFFANAKINGANVYKEASFTDNENGITLTGSQFKGVTLNSEKKHVIYAAGIKDVATVTLGSVTWQKGATLLDGSSTTGYNFAAVKALGTDGFDVSYASPETVAANDIMTLLKANETLAGEIAADVEKTKAYSYTPVEGVTVDAAVTGKMSRSGHDVIFTATANQASKLTFTNVDWKDSGALLTRPSNITFAGADVDTTKIHFKNVKELDANKKMTLVSDFGDSVGTITGTKYTVGAGLEGEGAASLSGSDLVFTTKTGVKDLAAQEQTHNTLMVMEAGMAVLAAGNEHVGQAMAELGNTQNAAVDGTVTAASLGGSKSRYKTGSHVDSDSWNVAVAVGSKRELKKGSLEWGVFGEYGKSNYTLHSDAGRGDGDSHYAGGGLMAKWTNKHDVYTEASVRLGRLNDTASNLLRDAAGNGYGYDVHANYFGAHVGIGKIIHYKGGKSLDVYGKYFYTKRDGVDFTSGGNNYSLDSMASSVLRVGARYGTTDKKWNWYGGLAYEYEFDGKSEGTVDGIGIRAASVKGGSVRGEIGMRMSATKNNPWQTDISIYGYGGKHRGFGGSVNVAYMF